MSSRAWSWGLSRKSAPRNLQFQKDCERVLAAMGVVGREATDVVADQTADELQRRSTIIFRRMASASAKYRGDRERFALQVTDDSVVDPGGVGVVVSRGSVPRGEVVCFFPGRAYAKGQHRFIEGWPDVQSRADSLLVRAEDGAILDSGGGSAEWVMRRMGYERGPWEWTRINERAVGHKVNHVGQGMEVNVVKHPVDFVLERAWSRVVPNRNWVGDQTGFFGRWRGLSAGHSNMAKGVAMIALRDIREGEELLLNYRLNPNARESWPPWYWDPAPDESQRRWSQEGMFL